ncbi:MAG: TrbC/VirB2 family protein [Endozoicomonas sp. (ex Botrylloides leachii)]|nr:TrbC/VirB2 family protein [Endozoicomonas sp. (ex Botrylloides leachii)]
MYNTKVLKLGAHTKVLWLLLVTLIALLFISNDAMASVGHGGGLPYENWLKDLRSSITGPVAFTLAIIGIVGTGGALIFGGDLNHFLRSSIFLVLIMALIIAAQNIMEGLFGHGAEIAMIYKALPPVIQVA